jgi:acyl-CoA thioester hydrolase
MPTKPYEYTITTRWADIDASRHLRHSAYFDWAAHVRTEWLSERGFTLSAMSELHVAPVLLEESIKYLKEIYIGERIKVDIECVGLSVDASRWHIRQHFKRGETVCARYEVKGAWLDTEKRRIAPPPPGLLEATSELVRTHDYTDITTSIR